MLYYKSKLSMDTKIKKIKLYSLTPIKVLNMMSRQLKNNPLAELIFAGVGVIATLWFGINFIRPYDASWKYAVTLLYVTIAMSFEVMFLISVWNGIQSFLINITSKGSAEYNKNRDTIRARTNKYYMGIDEKPKEPIDYFLKKEKGWKMFIYDDK